MDTLTAQLRHREKVRDHFWSKDSLCALRLFWRASTFRHLVHLLPGETILEIGAGKGIFTQALLKVTKGENPVVSMRFDESDAGENDPSVTKEHVENIRTALAGKRFTYVLAHQLMDASQCAEFLTLVRESLLPGGKFVLFESNPWNPVRKIRCMIGNVFPWWRRGDESALLNPVQLYQLLSELGFIRIGATCYDFLYSPIPRFLLRFLRNFSLICENTPGIRRLAGSLLVTGQVPPRDMERPAVSLTKHAELMNAVSIVVPCHNEEMNIGPLVDGLRAHYDAYIKEFVLVNDNSKDSTGRVMADMQAKDPRIKIINRTPPGGVGFALRDGIALADAPFILTTDSDFTHILPELRDMFDAVAGPNGADTAFGSRFSRESVLINYPLSKILCNRGFHLLLSILFRRRIRDVTNNLKLMRREVAKSLHLTQQHFAVNAEIGLQPVLMNYKCTEVPISWINRTPEMGKSSFKLIKVGMGYVRVLADLAIRTRCGWRKLEWKN